MTDEHVGTVEESPEKIELERLKAEYRRENKALDQRRELPQEEQARGWYSEEQANEVSRSFEEDGRWLLAEVQERIDAHCRAHGMLNEGSFSGSWAKDE